jgi:hypothetical protein
MEKVASSLTANIFSLATKRWAGAKDYLLSLARVSKEILLPSVQRIGFGSIDLTVKQMTVARTRYGLSGTDTTRTFTIVD